MLSSLRRWGFGGLSGSPATISEEVAELRGGSFLEKAAFDEDGVVEAGIGGDVVEGAGVSGLGVGGRVDQARETACVGGAGAHGAGLQRGVEGATGQPPASYSGGCATYREEFGVGSGIPGSLTLVGGDGQDLPSPGDDRPDGNLAFLGRLFCGEQGQAHHGEVGLRRIACFWHRHKTDDSNPITDVVAGDSAKLGPYQVRLNANGTKVVAVHHRLAILVERIPAPRFRGEKLRGNDGYGKVSYVCPLSGRGPIQANAVSEPHLRLST